jgi:hypothetical protein
MTGERFNVYLPATLAQRVREARRDGRELDLSAEAARGIAAALNGHQAPAARPVEQQRQEDGITGRLDAIEQLMQRLSNAVSLALLVLGIGVAVVSVRAFATS